MIHPGLHGHRLQSNLASRMPIKFTLTTWHVPGGNYLEQTNKKQTHSLKNLENENEMRLILDSLSLLQLKSLREATSEGKFISAHFWRVTIQYWAIPLIWHLMRAAEDGVPVKGGSPCRQEKQRDREGLF